MKLVFVGSHPPRANGTYFTLIGYYELSILTSGDSMKLKVKAALGIASVLLISGAIVTTLFNQVILDQFKELEDVQAERNGARILEALQAEVRATQALVKDWGMWDDAYSFVKSGTPEFVEANLTYPALDPINTDHLIFLDQETQPIFSTSIDRENEKLAPMPNGLIELILNSEISRRVLDRSIEKVPAEASEGAAGFFRFQETDYILAAVAVTDSEGKATPAGVLCMLRAISPKLIDRLSEQTKVGITLTQLAKDPGASAPVRLTEFREAISKIAFSKTDSIVNGEMRASDIQGMPLFVIKLSMPREVFHKGLDVGQFLTSAFVGITGVTALLVIAFMQWLIVSPVAALGASLIKISQSADFTARVNADRRDELGALAVHINETLESLQHAIQKSEQAQRQAESANRAKSSFIAKVSHELRTPIHSITGMLRILLKEERSSGKRNYIMMAKNAAYGLLETINEILDFSKAEAGKLVLERIEFSLHEVIRESMQTIGPRVEEKGSLEAVARVAQGIPKKLYGDPMRLRQVLVNLLGNATKFTKQGHVGLAVSMLENEAERTVLQIVAFDTGVGIPSDRLEHIFEPFGQADESVSRMFTGTGLGLTIVKQFIEGMGGSVTVESEVGVGSRFILTIPFDVPESSEGLVYRPRLTTPRVALIDGDSLLIDDFSQELEENGYIPEIFRSDEPHELDLLSKSISQFGLILATSEAIKRSRVFDLVVELRGRESTPVVTILSPFEISVRERLLALEVPFVVTRPISLIDILGVVSGEISLNNEGWEDAEDWSLQSGRPLDVLIADDAQTNRIILTELLRDAGHNVVCVENGVDMVARIKDSIEGVPGAGRFDIVLTDVQMPLLDGLSATAQIRTIETEQGVSSRLPIVAVTAHAMTDETSRMRAFGVDDVITKPLDPLKLGQVIQRLTGRSLPETQDSERVATNVSLTDTQLAELALRLWTKLAQRDSSVRELFGLSETPASPEDFQRVLDIGDVIERSGNSVRRSLLIFSGFLECFREQLQKLNDAKLAKSSEELRFAAHALKGLLLDVGARVSGGLASDIEQLCKGDDGEAALMMVGQLTRQILLVARLVAQIKDLASGDVSSQAVALKRCQEDDERLEQD